MENNKQSNFIKRKLKEKIFLAAIFIFSLLAIIPLFLILGYVFINGITAVNWQFFTQLPTPVGEPGGGMANAIVGTLIIVLIACVIGLPIGILGGVWLAERGRGKTGFFIRYAADVLSGIPSIVIGIFAYTLIVFTMKRFSALAGGFALGVIMIPTVTRTSEELIKMVPTSLREAGLALGVPEWKVSLRVVLRTAWGGIFTGIMLAVARISGETAPLIFTSFNNQFWSFRLDQPMASMTVQIYNYAISPYADWHRKAWAGSLVLVMIVLCITLIFKRFSKRINYG